jgi:hypothetical protein
MPPGSWFLMKHTDTGKYGPESMISCPNCMGDVIFEGAAALGKAPLTHPSRTYYDPRMPNRTLTRICAAVLTLLTNQGIVQYTGG